MAWPERVYSYATTLYIRAYRMIRAISPTFHALLMSHIPVRYLNTGDHAPPGRPLRFNDLGRPLDHREKYKIKKWRAEGVTEMVIKARIVSDAKAETDNLEF